jgi:hypothetical protein
VQHNHAPADGEKIDGMQHTRYRRKNWSSCVLWNVGHRAHDALTPAIVNTATGSYLHAFEWLPDEAIGALPPEWNWLSGVDADIANPKAVHYTYGTPDMPGHEHQAFAGEWWKMAHAGAEDAAATMRTAQPGRYLGHMGKEIPW